MASCPCGGAYPLVVEYGTVGTWLCGVGFTQVFLVVYILVESTSMSEEQEGIVASRHIVSDRVGCDTHDHHHGCCQQIKRFFHHFFV